MLPTGTRLVRVMPNTPSMVQCGVSVCSPGPNSTPDDVSLILKLFGSVGIAESLPERLLEAVTGLSGSGPAYVSPNCGSILTTLAESVDSRLQVDLESRPSECIHSGGRREGCCHLTFLNCYHKLFNFLIVRYTLYSIMLYLSVYLFLSTHE